MQSQIENYRTKAREFARLAAVAKSRRDARHCRKFADMYWALALGDEPMRFQPPQKPAPRALSARPYPATRSVPEMARVT